MVRTVSPSGHKAGWSVYKGKWKMPSGLLLDAWSLDHGTGPTCGLGETQQLVNTGRTLRTAPAQAEHYIHVSDEELASTGQS